MEFTFRPRGVCSQMMDIEIEDNKLVKLKVMGGCSGNLQGVSRLCVGKHIDEIIAKLQGIQCRNKTSCPDQLAQALLQYKEEHNLA